MRTRSQITHVDYCGKEGAPCTVRNHSSVAGKLLSLVASVMDVPTEEVGEDADFETLKTWDSAREVELALMLEFEYAVTIGDDEMSRLHSVREIRALLASHGITEQ